MLTCHPIIVAANQTAVNNVNPQLQHQQQQSIAQQRVAQQAQQQMLAQNYSGMPVNMQNGMNQITPAQSQAMGAGPAMARRVNLPQHLQQVQAQPDEQEQHGYFQFAPEEIPKSTSEAGSPWDKTTTNKHTGGNTGLSVKPELRYIYGDSYHSDEAEKPSRMQNLERARPPREEIVVGSSNDPSQRWPHFPPQDSIGLVNPVLRLQEYPSTKIIQGYDLDDLSSVAANSLGLPDVSTVNFEALQACVRDLERKADSLEILKRQQEPSECQIFHQLAPGKMSQLYFDVPQWVVGEEDSRALRSSLPVSDVESVPGQASRNCLRYLPRL
jgi:hypothetical protein